MGGQAPLRKVENVVPPPQKQKTWKLDKLRNDDRLQMQNLVRKLHRCREEGQSAIRRANPPSNLQSNVGSANVSRKAPSNRIVTKKPSTRPHSPS